MDRVRVGTVQHAKYVMVVPHARAGVMDVHAASQACHVVEVERQQDLEAAPCRARHGHEVTKDRLHHVHDACDGDAEHERRNHDLQPRVTLERGEVETST